MWDKVAVFLETVAVGERYYRNLLTCLTSYVYAIPIRIFGNAIHMDLHIGNNGLNKQHYGR